MNVMFVTAEMEPLVSTGGLGAASAGLVAELRESGVDCTPVLPDYRGLPLRNERVTVLDVPSWVGGATARAGVHDVAGSVVLIDVPGIARPHPYVDPATGHGWADNDHRFFAWSCAVAAFARMQPPDIVHVNDWHAATVLAHLPATQRTVLSIHNLAHQGWGDEGWLDLLGFAASSFAFQGSVNALAGAIRLADQVVTVSPTYADEIRQEWSGMGLAPLIRERSNAVMGILNGIDTREWNPDDDPHLAVNYAEFTPEAKAANQARLCEELGLPDGPGPLVVCVSRLDHQKAIELVVQSTWVLPQLPARLAVLGSGDPLTERSAGEAALASDGRFVFRQGYDQALAHRMFAAGDLTIIPSRFEPCGLTQMQAMRYGVIPIVSDVGGLHDTVVDADRSPRTGTGIVMGEISVAGVIDGMHRGVRCWQNRARRTRVVKRGMAIDWSWAVPAAKYRSIYEQLVVDPEGPT